MPTIFLKYVLIYRLKRANVLFNLQIPSGVSGSSTEYLTYWCCILQCKSGAVIPGIQQRFKRDRPPKVFVISLDRRLTRTPYLVPRESVSPVVRHSLSEGCLRAEDKFSERHVFCDVQNGCGEDLVVLLIK